MPKGPNLGNLKISFSLSGKNSALAYYPHYTPRWITRFIPHYTAAVDTTAKELFLTFDDGPHPSITPWVMEQLARYEAEATFFLLGKNIKAQPAVMEDLLASGHGIGNHTYTHEKAWLVPEAEYLNSIAETDALLQDYGLGLGEKKVPFRPPYGRLTLSLAKQLGKERKLIGWEILTGDFDLSLRGEDCFQRSFKHLKRGGIIVCHDSEKAFPRLQTLLPKLLAEATKQGFKFRKLPVSW